ncbi:hypothetical protein [Aquimarina sediminis]|uniref:hypothetical protein n=1 Tax=Aquimarina sediminis TaxID=2070536 RepID=UPI000CA0048D|nr:hypothetical protein [Aquimarina sediminis]
MNSKTYIVCNSDNLYSEAALRDLRSTDHANAFVSYDRDVLQFSLECIAQFTLVSLDEEGFLKNVLKNHRSRTVSSIKIDLANLG